MRTKQLLGGKQGGAQAARLGTLPQAGHVGHGKWTIFWQ